jgi:hypothetical protein
MYMCLQKTTGEDASGITMQEANHIVKELLKALSAAKAQHGFKRTDKFYICYDGASVHNQIAAVLGSRAHIWPQPSHSPDCNKPIEHVHAQVDEKMKEWLKQRQAAVPRQKITVEEAKAECTRVFTNISQTSIASDVASLPQTWQSILDHHGSYVPDALS